LKGVVSAISRNPDSYISNLNDAEMKNKCYWKNKNAFAGGWQKLGTLSMLYSQLSEKYYNNIKCPD